MDRPITRIRRRTEPDIQHDVLDVGERYYVVPGVDFEPTTVSKEEYEPVPQADPDWVNVTPCATLECSKLNGKHSLFLGHKRIGYVLLHTPYRLRLTGEYLILEKPDGV